MELLKKEVADQGIEAVFWPGIRDLILPCRGISKAHKQIVRHAKENALPWVTIAEDDIKFFAPGAFSHFISNTPTDFDLYLGNVFSGEVRPDQTVTDFAGLTLYVVHQRFYDRFLTAREINNLDREMKSLGGRYLVCDPMVCSQHGGYTDNRKKVVPDYNKYFEGRSVFSESSGG